MGQFVRVCKTTDVSDPGKAVFQVGDRFVLVCHVEGKFYAISDCCTHDDGPLGEGMLEGHCITCPRHGAKFDIRDGRVLSMPATRPTPAYDVTLQDDDVFVKLAD